MRHKTWRPCLEWANMTLGGHAIDLLWGERDATLREMIRLILNLNLIFEENEKNDPDYRIARNLLSRGT